MRLSSFLFAVLTTVALALPQHDHHSDGSGPTPTSAVAPPTTAQPTAAPPATSSPTRRPTPSPSKPTLRPKPHFSFKWPIRKPTKSTKTPATPSASIPPLPSGFSKADPIDDKPRTPGARIVKQRLGPWTLKPHSKLANALLPNVTHPCNPGETCFGVAYQANLIYEDGTEANADTGCWLHHALMLQVGAGISPPICADAGLPRRPVFSTGNERSTIRINAVHPYGMKITPDQRLALVIELMNESSEERTLYLTQTWEVVSGYAARKYHDAVPLWLDASGCNGADVPAQEGYYELRTPTWTSTINGKLLAGGGHVHDGGVSVTLYKNNQPVCKSEMIYGRKPGYVSVMEPEPGHEGHGMEPMVMKHISDASGCRDFGEIKKGDELYAVSVYNATLHPQMMHDGVLHPVMGIASVYIGPDPEEASMRV